MVKMSVAAALIGAVTLATSAQAQDRFEANTQGYFGGYSNFGGYYDTFGGYGGNYAYGYRRSNGNYSPTATFLAVPIIGPSENGEPCAWLRQRAHETGARKWKARYTACRNGN